MITEILKFAGDHVFLAWCALWLVWLPMLLVPVLVRGINVLIHGWPPAHVDEDGDHRP